MKMVNKVLATVMGASLLLVAGVTQAESTYGYQANGTGDVSATAKLKVKVTIPKLILLRVGTAGATVDELEFSGSPDVTTITSLTDGDSGAADWDGSAPTFGDTAAQSVNAFAWTNATGATLSCSTAEDAALTGLSPASISVAKTAGSLDHPGTDTGCSGSNTTITPNTLMTATWDYSIAGTTLLGANAGVYQQTTTYTATTL